MPFLSFIVGVRNRDSGRVQQFLESLRQQNNTDFELVFVDFGSDASLSEEFRKLLANCSFARYFFFNSRGQHWNRGKCLNYAAAQCKGNFIFTCDVDFLFTPDFVKKCQSLAEENKAFYFKVGFLSPAQTNNLRFPLKGLPVNQYSDKNAIGALLISASMFKAIGGYDEFFEIWGLEDNDLLHRISVSQFSITFFEEATLIWHLWHVPAKRSGVLPDGWLKLLADYFENKKTTLGRPDQNYYCRLDNNRPLLLNKAVAKSIQVKCGPKYLDFLMEQELQAMSSDAVIELRFDFKDHERAKGGRLNSFLKKINAFLFSGESPLQLINKNMEAYLSEKKARELLCFFVKRHASGIRDYYLPEDLSAEHFYLMKA